MIRQDVANIVLSDKVMTWCVRLWCCV
jgi:hypothetical protein